MRIYLPRHQDEWLISPSAWSAPSGIATAGLGFGSQLGAEVTDFLFVLSTSVPSGGVPWNANAPVDSKAAVRSFMSAASVTLGGSLSVALGPIGRTGEAGGAVNTDGQIAAM